MIKMIKLKFSFNAAARRLGIEKEALQRELEKICVFEFADEMPELLVQEGYLISEDDFDPEGGYYVRNYLTEKGMKAFATLLKKEEGV
jgi:hypothetical protein